MQSYIFDFRMSDTFMTKGWNKKFDVENLEEYSFYIVLVDDNCGNNFSDCVDNEGQLIYTDENSIKAECELNYTMVNKNVENIFLVNDCTFDFAGDELLPDSFNMKGAFLVNEDNYVLGYSINNYSIKITTQMIFEKDLIFYDIIEGSGLGGE